MSQNCCAEHLLLQVAGSSHSLGPSWDCSLHTIADSQSELEIQGPKTNDMMMFPGQSLNNLSDKYHHDHRIVVVGRSHYRSLVFYMSSLLLTQPPCRQGSQQSDSQNWLCTPLKHHVYSTIAILGYTGTNYNLCPYTCYQVCSTVSLYTELYRNLLADRFEVLLL